MYVSEYFIQHLWNTSQRLALTMLAYSGLRSGTWWLSGSFGALHPEGRRFKSHSHVSTLDKSFTRSCLWRFGLLTLTQYQCCSWERLWVVVDLKRRYRILQNEWTNSSSVIIDFQAILRIFATVILLKYKFAKTYFWEILVQEACCQIWILMHVLKCSPK